MDISILVVNYNTADLLQKCIASLLMQQGVQFEILVVDNNSRDHSLNMLQAYSQQITLFANKDNKGFGKANNQAFKACTGRYIFMLNPDAVCLQPNDLHNLVQFMDQHPHFGLVGTRIINSDEAVMKTAYGHYPHQKQTSINFSDLPGEWATVLGASMVARADVFAKVGGFDESYFLYAEETDLCLRIRKAGYMIGYMDQVTVQHVGGASEKGNPSAEVVRKKKSGKYLFYSKHYLPADVRKIAKHDLFHSRLKLWVLTLKKVTLGLSAKQKRKYEIYQVSYDIAKSYLRATPKNTL